MPVNRAGNPNETQAERIARLRREEYERQQRAEQERIAQEREDREALEVERLQQLADAQPDANLFHGEPEFGNNFDPTMGYGGSGVYARPATGYNYEDDIYEITYYEMFGEPSLADQNKFQAEFEELLGSEDTWSEEERQQIEATRDSFMAGEINPWSMNVKNMYAEFNIKQRNENEKELEEAGVDSYVPRATNLTEAKQHADEVYMEVLQNAYDENPTDELAQAIEQGSLNFDKAEDVELYHSLPEDSIQRQAFDAQGTVVSDFLNRTEGDAFDSESLEQGQTFGWGWGGKAGTTLLNTGTIVGAPAIGRDNVTFGEFGQYGNYSYDDPPEPSTFQKNMSITFDVLSVIYPPLAPVFQGVKTIINTGDIEEAFKSAGKAYIVKEVGSSLNAEIKTAFEDFNIDLGSLPEPVQDILVETTGGVLSGQSGEEALTGALKNQLTDVVVDDLNLDEDQLVSDIKDTLGLDPNFELPAPLQNILDDTTGALVSGDSASDAFDSSVESEVKDYAGGLAEDVVKTGADVLADALPDIDIDTPEPIKQIGDALVAGGEAVGGLLGDVFEPVSGLVEEGLDVVQGVTEPLVDLVDDGLDYIGEEYVDPALQALDDALPHGTTPETPDIDLPDIDLNLAYTPTETESLFGNEIGKIYRTPIETYKPAFSQDEIQGMLQQRYRG
jgi:hypothetical protein